MWYIWYYQGGYISIKETFEANGLDEAKEKAIDRIKVSLNNTISYYNRLLKEINNKTS